MSYFQAYVTRITFWLQGDFILTCQKMLGNYTEMTKIHSDYNI